MKVKELIERLSKLDPERNIWIGYDFPFDIQEPMFEEYSGETREIGYINPMEIENGDYIHCAE